MKRIITKIMSTACLCVATVFTGCQQEGIEDKGVQLHYAGLTNIGPNMGAVLTPHWFGGQPADFRISGVTLEGASYSGPEFTINSQTGEVTVTGYQANEAEGINETPSGEYKISVSCTISGRTYTFKDVITVTFFKGVPEGITVTPAEHEIKLQNLAEGSAVTLPGSEVTTDGDHIAITGYRIANVRLGEEVIDNTMTPMFSISDTGQISMIKGSTWQIGTYVIDLKLNTGSYGNDSEVGLFADALKVKVVSAPLAISYTPSSGILEEEDESRKTSHTSAAPVLTGSPDEAVWSIAGVEPETDKISIDPATGVISIAEGHALAKDVTYKVDVTVRNKYSEDEGLTVPEAYSVDIVAYIAPIENFAYAPAQKKFALAWSATPNAATTGVRSYSWAEPEAEYTAHLSLDATTGEVSALKGNLLPEGTYEIKVKAENGKEGGEVTAVLNFTVEANPYYISDFSYGNNLDLTEEETDGVSQFRFTNEAELVAYSPEIQYGDVLEAEGVTYTFAGKNTLNGENTTLDQTNGKITFVEPFEKEDGTRISPWTDGGLGCAFITATSQDPDDAENTFSVTCPVFFDYANPVSGVSITYTPFVLRVNPKDGRRSVVPVIASETVDASKVLLDYRRTFNWYNLEGIDSNGEPHVNGQPNAGGFLAKIWDIFTDKTGLNKKNDSANYGSKVPVSYYSGVKQNLKTQEQLAASPAYIDNSSGANFGSLIVNPGLWMDGNNYADGIFHGQITFAIYGTTEMSAETDAIKYLSESSNPNKIFPIAIWLDKDFVK